MREAFLYSKTGLYCREGTSDRNTASEVLREYASLPVKDRVVVDVGANVGAFTRMVVAKGARRVVAVEPEPSNFECLKANTADFEGRVALVRGCAAVADGETTLYLSPTAISSPVSASQTRLRGPRIGIKVPAVAIGPLLAGAESVKIDAEGAEYVIGWPGLLPETVRDVIVELLPIKPYRDRSERLVRAYEKAGWTVVASPKAAAGPRMTIVHWQRQRCFPVS